MDSGRAWSSSASGGYRRVGHGLYHDFIGDFLADAEARVADETDNIGVATKKLDALLFAEAQFPQAFLHLGSGVELFDADGDANLHAAQGAELRPGALSGENLVVLSLVHLAQAP